MSYATDVLTAGLTYLRDYRTDGVPASGEMEPDKIEGRALVAAVSAAVAGLDGAIVDLAAAMVAAGAIVVEASADLPSGTDAAVGLVLTGTDAGLWARPDGGSWAATGLTMAGAVAAQVAANAAAILEEEAARIAAIAALGDLSALDVLPLDKIAPVHHRRILGRGGPTDDPTGTGQVYELTPAEVRSIAEAASAADLGAEEAARIAADDAEATARSAAIAGLADDIADKMSAPVEALQTIGRAAVVSGTAASALTYVYGDTIDDDGYCTRLRCYASSAGTVEVGPMALAEGVFSRADPESWQIVSVAIGANALAINVPVSAGQHIAASLSGSGVITYTSGSASEGGGHYSGAAGAESFAQGALSTGNRLELGFDFARTVSSDEMLADIRQAQADIADLQAGTGETTGVVQTIGRAAADIPAGGSVTVVSAGVWVHGQVVTSSGLQVQRFRWQSSVAGQMLLGLYSITGPSTGATITLVSDQVVVTGVVGANTVDLVLDDAAGLYIGVDSQANGRLTYVAGAGAEVPGRYGPGTTGTHSFTGAISTSSNRFQWGFDIVGTIGSTSGTIASHTFDLKSSTSIVMIGDSLTESIYSLKGKSWIALASLYSSAVVHNFSIAGHTTQDRLNDLRSGATTFGLPYTGYGATHALILTGVNDYGGGATVDTLRDRLRQLAETAEGLGAKPALARMHYDMWGLPTTVLYAAIARQMGIDLVDTRRNYDLFQLPTTKTAGFWNGGHPGLRTNDILGYPVQQWMQTIDVAQSIKIFRARNTVTYIDDLRYIPGDDYYSRALAWQEISVGARRLSSGNEEYYDELPAVTLSAQYTRDASEYLTLMSGATISMGEYMLLDITMPALAKHIDSIEITLGVSGATAYVLDPLATPYASTGETTGNWVSVTPTGSVLVLGTETLTRCMWQDRLPVLLYKAGGITLSEPSVTWTGQAIKPRRPAISLRPARGAELLAVTDCGTATGWTAAGSPTVGVPTDGSIPLGTTGRTVISPTATISQALTMTADPVQTREIEITVWPRRFPSVFASSSTYPDAAPITETTHDQSRVYADLVSGGVTSRIEVTAGLWWRDLKVRTVIPAGMSAVTLTLSADRATEISKASVRLVD